MRRFANGYDVFLSYTAADIAAAEVLRVRLSEAGLRTFLDRYSLPAGQSWQPQLEAAIASCRALVVLLGPSGLGAWQHREIQLGLDRQAAAEKRAAPFPVIPVLLPRLKDDDIPLGRFVGLNTWVDLRQSLDEPEALQRHWRAYSTSRSTRLRLPVCSQAYVPTGACCHSANKMLASSSGASGSSPSSSSRSAIAHPPTQ